jgi:hypothetical protein
MNPGGTQWWIITYVLIWETPTVCDVLMFMYACLHTYFYVAGIPDCLYLLTFEVLVVVKTSVVAFWTNQLTKAN